MASPHTKRMREIIRRTKNKNRHKTPKNCAFVGRGLARTEIELAMANFLSKKQITVLPTVRTVDQADKLRRSFI